jgi:hypothetical protein
MDVYRRQQEKLRAPQVELTYHGKCHVGVCLFTFASHVIVSQGNTIPQPEIEAYTFIT